MIYGTAGRFIIQNVDVDIPLYLRTKGKEQAIVDEANSALLYPRFGGGHCDYICDHAAQGFDRIKRCPLGAVAFILTPTSTQFYTCVALTTGTNTGKNVVTLAGQKLTNIKWADLCAYTCNDDKGVSVSMVFFKKGLKLPYNLFADKK